MMNNLCPYILDNENWFYTKPLNQIISVYKQSYEFIDLIAKKYAGHVSSLDNPPVISEYVNGGDNLQLKSFWDNLAADHNANFFRFVFIDIPIQTTSEEEPVANLSLRFVLPGASRDSDGRYVYEYMDTIGVNSVQKHVDYLNRFFRKTWDDYDIVIDCQLSVRIDIRFESGRSFACGLDEKSMTSFYLSNPTIYNFGNQNSLFSSASADDYVIVNGIKYNNISDIAVGEDGNILADIKCFNRWGTIGSRQYKPDIIAFEYKDDILFELVDTYGGDTAFGMSYLYDAKQFFNGRKESIKKEAT